MIKVINVNKDEDLLLKVNIENIFQIIVNSDDSYTVICNE